MLFINTNVSSKSKLVLSISMYKLTDASIIIKILVSVCERSQIMTLQCQHFELYCELY